MDVAHFSQAVVVALNVVATLATNQGGVVTPLHALSALRVDTLLVD